MMLADKGYDGDDVRSSLLMHGILPVIPPKANRKEPIGCDFKAYKDRNRIERMFNRLKQSDVSLRAMTRPPSHSSASYASPRQSSGCHPLSTGPRRRACLTALQKESAN